MLDLILLKNNYVNSPSKSDGELTFSTLGTVVSNFAYYGYIPSGELLSSILDSDDDSVGRWWSHLDKILSAFTGDDKNIKDFVVYKNFPEEVLEMSQAKYWSNQILMYWGFPNEFFTQEEVARDEMDDNLDLKVLHLANDRTEVNILNELVLQPSRWNDEQEKAAIFLSTARKNPVDVGVIPFKENMVVIANSLIKSGASISMTSATDVLRLAVALSDGDVSLRTNSKFRNFSRAERRTILSMLENTSNLLEDIAMRKNVWKKLLKNLHPGDYKNRYPSVVEAYDILYNRRKISTFRGLLEEYIKNQDEKAIELISKRPGEFLRRLQKMISVFGKDAAVAFTTNAVPVLSTMQLLKIKNYIIFSDIRSTRMFPPKGNWTRVKIIENNISIDEEIKECLIDGINQELANRINERFPNGVTVDESADLIKLKDNDSELTDYGRGTSFVIPENISFIRTASYWDCDTEYNSWFDNGFNFFDDEWNSMGTICWNMTSKLFDGGAVFSGDPTNSKRGGKAAQMIDLYIDKLLEAGVRYAVWNILCFSKIKFSDANEVLASLQWGEDSIKGKLFEPSRCQLQFPINSNKLTSYIAYIDILKRRIVYMDASFGGSVQSAAYNISMLSEKMPAYLEYLEMIPSLKDLFSNAEEGSDLLVSYSDKEYDLKDQKTYIFRPENQENTIDQININELL